MKTELTEADKRKYVNGGYNRCPFCESTEISAGDKNADDNTMTQDVLCENCGSSWCEIYKLVDIQQD